MGVRYCDRQRIGSVRPSDLKPGQKDAQHRLHLFFLGLASAHNRFLHQPRSIFGHGRPVARRPQKDNAARLPKLQR